MKTSYVVSAIAALGLAWAIVPSSAETAHSLPGTGRR